MNLCHEKPLNRNANQLKWIHQPDFGQETMVMNLAAYHFWLSLRKFLTELYQ